MATSGRIRVDEGEKGREVKRYGKSIKRGGSTSLLHKRLSLRRQKSPTAAISSKGHLIMRHCHDLVPNAHFCASLWPPARVLVASSWR